MSKTRKNVYIVFLVISALVAIGSFVMAIRSLSNIITIGSNQKDVFMLIGCIALAIVCSCVIGIFVTLLKGNSQNIE